MGPLIWWTKWTVTQGREVDGWGVEAIADGNDKLCCGEVTVWAVCILLLQYCSSATHWKAETIPID